MNVEFDKEENLEIYHRARHIIKLKKHYIKIPFKFDPFPQALVFHSQAYTTKGRGAKVTVPTLIAQSLVRLETVHQLDR